MLKKQAILFWITVILAGLVLLTVSCQTAAAPYQYRGNLLDPPQPVPDFELRATDGSLFHLSDLEGKIALIFFGYTYCPDVCPLTVAKVQQTLANLDPADQERVRFIFISVDPERDTPQVLAGYLSNFNPDFIGLTDDFAQTEAVLKSFWAYADKEQLPEPSAHQNHDQAVSDQAQASPAYLVMHTGRIYLVTPQRELWLTYPSDLTAEDLESDLLYLLKQKSS
jgi:protein SCO1